jgi:hypothetical protein
MSDKRQKNQLVLAFTDESRSEAPRVSGEGTESLAAKRGTESPAIGEQLMEEVCERKTASRHWHESRPTKGVLAWTG